MKPQFTLDWSKAPEWANFLYANKLYDGKTRWGWYEMKPSWSVGRNAWVSGGKEALAGYECIEDNQYERPIRIVVHSRTEEPEEQATTEGVP